MAMTDLARGAYSGQFGFLLVEPKSEHGHYDQDIFLAACVARISCGSVSRLPDNDSDRRL